MFSKPLPSDDQNGVHCSLLYQSSIHSFCMLQKIGAYWKLFHCTKAYICPSTILQFALLLQDGMHSAPFSLVPLKLIKQNKKEIIVRNY